jgi:hypothetical protein
VRHVAVWLVVALSALAVAGAAAGGSPRVLGVLVTGTSIDVEPASVDSELYTVQMHNIGQYTVHVRIGKTVDVVVPPNGWRFRDLRFVSGKTYAIRVVGPAGAWLGAVHASG